MGQKNMLYPVGIYISPPRKRLFLTQIQSVTYCLYNATGRMLSFVIINIVLQSLCTGGMCVYVCVCMHIYIYISIHIYVCVCVSQMLCGIGTEAYFQLLRGAPVFINKK